MENTWQELTIKTKSEAVEAITNILYDNGASGVIIDDPSDFNLQKANEYDWDYIDEDFFNRNGDESVYIKTYISDEKNVNEFIDIVKTNINDLSEFGIDIGEGSVSTSQVQEEDWANNWKQYYKPFRVGEKIVIKPEWEEYKSKEEDLVVEINPGMAFGTGDHETTYMCIASLEKYVDNSSVVYDIGCGSGILGIVAAKLGAKEVVGIDIDEVAVKVANENILKNDVESVMKAIKGNLADEIDRNKKADIIVANIMADIIVFLTKDVKSYLKDGGVFISSGIIHAKIDDVTVALKENGFNTIEVQKKGEWSCIIAR